MRAAIADALEGRGQGHGVLVLTDMFGGTPSNIALSFLDEHRVEVVTGVNLPMLIKLATLREEKPLEELAAFIKSYGQRNISVASEILPDERREREPLRGGSFTVQPELGLHARPAGRFVALAGRFDARSRWRATATTSGSTAAASCRCSRWPPARGTALRVRAAGPDAARGGRRAGPAPRRRSGQDGARRVAPRPV